MKITYSKAGVNVKKVKKIQNKINRLLFSTANPFTPKFLAGHYAGIFTIGKTTLAAHCDGVGTKILVAQALNKHNTIGIDAVAMNVNDLVCIGAKPIVGLDYLAISKEDEKLIQQILSGVINGCKMANIALIGGETAILSDMFSSPKNKTGYDLAMSVIGVVENKLIDGSNVKPNQILIGLPSSGLHSNGFSLARKILDIKKWGKEMLTPTILYDKIVLKLINECDITAIAHITGGAFSKLSRISNISRCGFYLENMPQPKGIFSYILDVVKDPKECYRTFNMGIGMVLVAQKNEQDKILDICKEYKINAEVIGTTIAKKDVLLNFEGRKISLL
ncbi:MAG: phosphoribosylformylglycinamidine cyclo-ligase [Candidatus Anstonellaceae archaeon]